MSREAMSISRQLMASQLDEPIHNYRTELHLWGALEAWASLEGLTPWDDDQFTFEDRVATFVHGGGVWTAIIEKSVNFPDVEKMEIRLLLASVSASQKNTLLDLIVALNNSHFTLAVSPGDDGELLVTAVDHVGSEPKNMQLAIGVAINDILSHKDELVQRLSKLPDTRALLTDCIPAVGMNKRSTGAVVTS